MLSILIPVFNFDVREFVRKLHEQAIKAEIPFEIILADDASSEQYRTLNRDLSSLEHIKLLELDQNIGRSAIRNHLASMATGKYLLFLDCDSDIEHDDFISRYVSVLKPDHVITGGRSYKEVPPDDNRTFFRWYYGVKRESMTAASRKKKRYSSFMTNNFLIPAEIFQKIRFNETLSGYGHEDTLFGTELKRRHIDIYHIDNPLCHIGLESAEEFLDKTRQGIKNLAYLMKLKLVDDDIRLSSAYNTLKKLHLLSAYRIIFDKLEQGLLENLKSPQPSLRKFDLYKLGLLARELRDS